MPEKSNQVTVWKDWIEQCQSVRHKLSKWESDFIDSIEEQLQDRGSLSEKQAEILERIYSEKT